MAHQKLARIMLAPTAALLTVIGFAASPAQAAVWSSSDQWGNYTTSDGYTVYNNIWGSGAGSQTVWANSASNWGVWADHPATGGIKSYPDAKKVINKSISSLSSLKSSYNVTVPSSGAYNTSYDIWDSGHANEIMLWVNYNGAVGPLGTSVGNVTLGAHTWTVYVGSNGANNVYSFLRTSDSSSGTVDILAVLKWMKDTKGYIGNATIGDVQFGYEITSSAGGLNFNTNSFNVTSS
ncbi:GH12 family glycosyl hydrolase domain-containing protein [Streptomyces sp. NBC_01465]|uniref:GH12 family glycosyl hydrolase domain-containing protein n=1 Tax=Streptomyces sp. NBC_01465 TaxID=2903878 RepID=UPI002E35068D|nr:hypothetical protein [Streptomyces sp. NBC_01465]